MSKFSCMASLVVFCAVVHRYRPQGMSRKFRELADAFNIRLRERTADVPYHVCWAHSHLDRLEPGMVSTLTKKGGYGLTFICDEP